MDMYSSDKRSSLNIAQDSVAETNYELFAVVIHRGTCYSGHYYGYIKDIDHIGNWIAPPTPTCSSSVSSFHLSLSNRSTLIYSHRVNQQINRNRILIEILLEQVHRPIPLEQIGIQIQTNQQNPKKSP